MTTACPNKPFTVGLTGGIGSGKSTIAEHFTRLGAGLVDTDQIAHILTAPGGAAMPAIIESFGPELQTSSGALDRARMRALVFSDPVRKAELEAILHPMIRAQVCQALAECRTPYTLLAVPLLLETGHYLGLCQRVLVVDCPEEIQIVRVMRRSHLSRAEVLRIMASQASRQARLAHASEVIDNSLPPETLPARIAQLHAAYTSAAQACNQIS